MKFIKLFEAWELRSPKSATLNEVEQKVRAFKGEEFSAEEKRFFDKLYQDNRGLFDTEIDLSQDGTLISLSIYNMGNLPEDDSYSGLINIEIFKRIDSWYIIEVQGLFEGDGYYIADEFEEVKGFLGTETTLRFD